MTTPTTGTTPTTLRIWTIKYTATPTNYNRAQVARIEAATAAEATALLLDRLGENYTLHANHERTHQTYVKNYVLCEPQPYEPPQAQGRILAMDASADDGELPLGSHTLMPPPGMTWRVQKPGGR